MAAGRHNAGHKVFDHMTEADKLSWFAIAEDDILATIKVKMHNDRIIALKQQLHDLNAQEKELKQNMYAVRKKSRAIFDKARRREMKKHDREMAKKTSNDFVHAGVRGVSGVRGGDVPRNAIIFTDGS